MARRTPVQLDHLVLEVGDPLRSLDFYESVVGLARVREREFRGNEAPFPSVRVNGQTLIDLFPPPMWRGRRQANPHHFCLTLSAAGVLRLKRRLKSAGIAILQTSRHNFGARGYARSIYFHDPDSVVIEARYYPSGGRRRQTRGRS